jgi:ABC-2 type transport system ATP-binding protein
MASGCFGEPLGSTIDNSEPNVRDFNRVCMDFDSARCAFLCNFGARSSDWRLLSRCWYRLRMPPALDSSQPDAVLAVVDLCKSYAHVNAVERVSFAVRRKEIVGLLGPNGAGKTTTINMILGVLAPTSGSIAIAGIDVTKRRSQALACTNFAAVYATLPGNLTVAQNLRFFGLIYGIPNLAARIETLIAKFDLTHLRDTRCGVLSSGEQTRVALAKALLNQPRLLLLDEPTASMDPSAAQIVRKQIRELALEQNCGILWTSHNMYEVEEVCDRVLFLSHGRILLEGDPRALPGTHGAHSLEELFIQLAREPLHAA